MASRKIGPYRIEDKLGAGGMGEVFRAYDGRLDRRVAIKLIRPEVLASAEARRRFRREARSAARLSHPAIVQVHDILESEEGDSIVMELVEGRTLSSLLADGPLEIGRALALAREIAEGLAEAHAKGIVHRDLKADNVMVTPAGHVKILDFGLAKGLTQAETDLSVEGRILGTVHAMSPEQAQGFEVDSRSDLFSFGSLLYQTVTRRSPFQGSSPVQTLTRIATFRQPSAREVNPQVPEALSRLIDRLLEKDPLHRPRTAAGVASELGGIAAAWELSGAPVPNEREASAGDSLSGAPTLAAPPLGRPRVASEGVALLRRPRDSDEARRVAAPAAAASARRRRAGVMAVSVLLATVFLAIRGLLLDNVEPLYAAVPRPRIRSAAEGQDPDLVASAVRLGLVRALLSRQGISTPDPDEVDAVSGTAAQVARALGVDEVVTSSLACDTQTCQVELNRIAGSDGSVLWADRFPVRQGDLLELTSVVAQRLRNGYPEHDARRGARDLEVDPGDYEEFLRLRRSWETRSEGASPAELLKAVTALEETSPGFPEAYLLEARIGQTLFVTSRRPADLERALDAVERVRKLAPGDPRALIQLFNIALDGARLELAEEALRGLRLLEPGHGRILAQEALLLYARGQTAEALARMRAAERHHSSWSNLIDLARMERQSGEHAAALDHLRELRGRDPDNYQVLFQLAMQEMTYGSLEEAIELLEKLRMQAPSAPGTRLNIALGYFGLARYERAARWFESVLEIEPAHLQATAALAFTQHLRGEEASAKELAGRALELAAEASNVADGEIHFLEAMALVALGRDEQAVAALLRFLPAESGSPFTAWQAALVYAAVDEKLSATTKAREALRQGLTPQWFVSPLFDFLRDDPELRVQLAGAGGVARE